MKKEIQCSKRLRMNMNKLEIRKNLPKKVMVVFLALIIFEIILNKLFSFPFSF